MSEITSKYSRYGKHLNSHDIIKFIALVIMTIDHVGAYLLPHDIWLRAIGRSTFPVWFFLPGFASSQKIKKDILILAFVMLIPHFLFNYKIFPLNALFSIMACRLLLILAERYTRLGDHLIAAFAACVIWLIPAGSMFEYGAQAVLYAIAGYVIRRDGRTVKTAFFMIGATGIFLWGQSLSYPFSEVQMAYVIITTAAVALYLFRFQVREWPLPEDSRFRPVVDAVRFLSRYSLYYYAVHRMLFQVIGFYLHPDLHQHFRWL